MSQLSEISDTERLDMIRQSLDKAGTPLTPSQLRQCLPKPYRCPSKDFASLLEDFVATGKLHRYVTTKATRYGLEDPAAFATRLILAALDDQPRSWTDLKKRPGLKDLDKLMDKSRIDGILDQLVAFGRAFRFIKGKRSGYGLESPDRVSSRAIRNAVDSQPRTQADLRKRPSCKHVDAFLTADRFESAIRDLVRDGRIFEWPRLDKIKLRYATRPVDVSLYVAPVVKEFRKRMDKLTEMLASVQIPREQVEEAARRILSEEVGPPPTTQATVEDAELEAQILEGMNGVDAAAATGAPVSFRKLRSRMVPPLTDKRLFDRVVLHLADKAIVALHRHDYPAGLSPAERDELVSDETGGFYLSISRRS
jgi:hypothetical protein